MTWGARCWPEPRRWHSGSCAIAMLKSLVDGAGPGVETEDREQLRADLVLLAAGVMPDWFQKLGIQVNERPSNNHAMVFNASFPGEQGRRAFERFTAHGPLAVPPLPPATDPSSATTLSGPCRCPAVCCQPARRCRFYQ